MLGFFNRPFLPRFQPRWYWVLTHWWLKNTSTSNRQRWAAMWLREDGLWTHIEPSSTHRFIEILHVLLDSEVVLSSDRAAILGWLRMRQPVVFTTRARYMHLLRRLWALDAHPSGVLPREDMLAQMQAYYLGRNIYSTQAPNHLPGALWYDQGGNDFLDLLIDCWKWVPHRTFEDAMSLFYPKSAYAKGVLDYPANFLDRLCAHRVNNLHKVVTGQPLPPTHPLVYVTVKAPNTMEYPMLIGLEKLFDAPTQITLAFQGVPMHNDAHPWAHALYIWRAKGVVLEDIPTWLAALMHLYEPSQVNAFQNALNAAWPIATREMENTNTETQWALPQE